MSSNLLFPMQKEISVSGADGLGGGHLIAELLRPGLQQA